MKYSKQAREIMSLIQAHQIAKALELAQKPTKMCFCEIPEGADEQIIITEEQAQQQVLSNSQPIKVLNIFDGSITEFETYEQCIDYIGVNYVNFQRMLDGKLKKFHQWQLIK